MSSMSTTNFGGWFAEQSPATGQVNWLTKVVGCGTLAAGLAMVGTGSMPRLEHRQATGLKPFMQTIPIANVEAQRTPAQNLSQIRKVLSPAISDLANCFSVSRQSIYNWLNGEPITEDHAAKLLDLALAADFLEFQGVTVSSMLLKRKFAQGKTLLQVVQAGESAQDAAKLLVQIVKREAEQRERLNTRFANRANGQTQPATADFDLPAANDFS